MAESRELQLLLTLKDEASKELSKFGSAFEKNRKAIGVAMTAIGASFVGFGTAAVKAAGYIETQRIGFKTLLGSIEAADEAIKMIQRDAASTPFELAGLMEANKALTLVTKNAQKSQDVLLNVGKALSAAGKGQNELNSIIVNLQQIGNTGKISEMDIRQFGFAGVNILELLADYYGTTKEAAGEMVKESKDAFADLSGAFALAGAEGGKFATAFADQAGSFTQSMSNFNDSWSQLLATLGTQLLPIITPIIQKITEVVVKIGEWASANPDLAQKIFTVVSVLGLLMLVLGPLLIALPAIVAGFSAVGAVLAFLVSPIGLVILAVGALIAIGLYLWKNWAEISTGLKIIWEEFVTKIQSVVERGKQAWQSFSDAIKASISGAFDSVKESIKSGINWIIDKLNFFVRAANAITSKLSVVPGISIPSIPEIPKLAEGGIVTRPTTALIGEAGPEAVVPLKKSGAFGGTTIIFQGGSFFGMSKDDLADLLSNSIMDKMRLNGQISL